MHGRKISLFALALFALTTACGIAQFPYGQDIAEQHVMGSPVGGLLGGTLVQIPISLDLSAQTAAHGTGPAQHVYLTDLTFAITPTDERPGDHDDFSFLSTIDIYVESTASGMTLPRTRVAHLSSIPAGARTIALATDGIDLIGYVREGARLSASATGHAPPTDVSFNGHLTVVIQVL